MDDLIFKQKGVAELIPDSICRYIEIDGEYDTCIRLRWCFMQVWNLKNFRPVFVPKSNKEQMMPYNVQPYLHKALC